MGVVTSILSALGTVKEIYNLLRQLYNSWLLMQEAQTKKKQEDAVKELENAKTSDEKKSAAEHLADSF